MKYGNQDTTKSRVGNELDHKEEVQIISAKLWVYKNTYICYVSHSIRITHSIIAVVGKKLNKFHICRKYRHGWVVWGNTKDERW